jgi:peptidyl-dipeptidase A
MGTAALDDDRFNLLTSTRTNMSGIYNKAKICPFDKQSCNLDTEGWSLDPDIELRLASSTNYDEMQYIWVKQNNIQFNFILMIRMNNFQFKEQWHEVSGKNMREQYKTYIQIYNEAAAQNNYSGDKFILKIFFFD